MMITFEGGEGSGKSTLIESFKNHLSKQGYEVLVTREPGGTALGESLRELLLNRRESITPLSELCLFLASRSEQNAQIIQPALEKQQIVLCDRYNDSTVAYQGGGRNLGVDYVFEICNKISGNIKPDLTFFLDIDPRKGLERKKIAATKEKKHEPLDRIEQEDLEFHQRVRNAYLTLSQRDPKRLFVIDASRSESDVLADSIKIFNHKMQ